MRTRTELLERAPGPVLPQPGEAVLCAVSGGLDSMCLLFMLEAWCRERGAQVAAAHFNHRLRGAEADRDEAFVREICEKWHIPLATGRGDVAAHARETGQTTEEAARNLRYAFLRQTASGRRIYTAHHAGDNAETVLLNLIRGTGLRGLTGMDWQRGDLCRPLLGADRGELEDYAARWSIPHVEDGTNGDPEAAARNLLRLRVMPLLKELNPRAEAHINRTAGQLRAVDSSLEEEARRMAAQAAGGPGRLRLPAEILARAPEPLAPRAVLCLVDRLGAGRKDWGAVHLEAVLDLARRGGGQLSLPGGVTARREGGDLLLERRPRPLCETPLAPGVPQAWGDYTLTLLDRREEEGLALAPGDGPVTVGPCPAAARLTLPGSRGARTVKRLCVDRGIPPETRDRLPAVFAEGHLAAVWRLGTDMAFLPEGEPVRFIKIKRVREAYGYEERDGAGYSEGPDHRGGAEAPGRGAGGGPL